MLSPSIVSFVAFEAILGGARVLLRGDNTIQNAGIADKELGVAVLYSGKSSYAAGDAVGVALVNHPGSLVCIAAGAIAPGAIVKRAANGQIAADGFGDNFGIALLDGSTAAGDYIEVLRDPTVLTTVADLAVTTAKLAAGAVATAKVAAGAVTGAKLDLTALKTYVVSGVDASVAPEDIAVVGALATDRIVSVVDLSTPAALASANFTPGAAKITQAQAAGNLSAKKLLIQTLPIAS